jgi:hypothetical protein
MPLTNAQKQRRWRDRRNDMASALTGAPEEVADSILRLLGVEEARRVTCALDRRLRDLKPDCPSCSGLGFVQMGPLDQDVVACLCDGSWDHLFRADQRA